MYGNFILVTGACGFIGAALTERLLKNGENVIGIDNLNSYYDLSLKRARLKNIEELSIHTSGKFEFHEFSIEDSLFIKKFANYKNISVLVHLAAQAGVRYSIENPEAYFQSNLLAFGNILELARKYEVNNFIFASSSSVYGGSKEVPFEEKQIVDYPVSLYAATKKSNEVLAHSYSHLYRIPTTGLRFFTVYGPFGRPDMAPMIFVKNILEKKIINVFNNGKMRRDFTFIDDIVEGILRCCYKPAVSDEDNNPNSDAPFRIFNIGNGKPIELMKFIELLEKKLNLTAMKEYLPMQKGDVKETFANTNALKSWINYSPSTSIEEGIDKFIDWYKVYYSID